MPTRPRPGRPQPTVSSEDLPSWDLLGVCLAVVILTYVWRFQDLFTLVRITEVTTLASLGAVGMFFFGSDRERVLSNARHPVTTTLLIIFAFAVASIPFGLYQGRSFSFVTGDLLKTLLIFLVLTSSIRNLAELKRFMWVFVAGAAIYSFYVNMNVSVSASGRLGNLYYYDSNDLAFTLVTTLPMVVFFLLRPKSQFWRMAAFGVLALMILLIVKTGSRGGFLGLLAVGGFLLVMLKEIPVRVRVGVVVLGFLGMTVFAGQQYWDTMATLLNPTEDYNWSGENPSGRMEVWKRGIGYMLNSPLVGVGARNFQIAEGSGTLSDLAAARQSIGRGWKWSAAHNSFVQIGAELGVFALLAFCSSLVYAFRAAYTTAAGKPGEHSDAPEQQEYRLLGQMLAASVIGYAVTGFFLSQAFSALLYVLLAFIVAYARLRPTGRAAAAPVLTGRRPIWAHGQPSLPARTAGH